MASAPIAKKGLCAGTQGGGRHSPGKVSNTKQVPCKYLLELCDRSLLFVAYHKGKRGGKKDAATYPGCDSCPAALSPNARGGSKQRERIATGRRGTTAAGEVLARYPGVIPITRQGQMMGAGVGLCRWLFFKEVYWPAMSQQGNAR